MPALLWSSLFTLACSGGAPEVGLEGSRPQDDSRRQDSARADDTAPDSADDSGPVDSEPPPPLPWSDAPCEAITLGDDPFADTLALWDARDDAAPPPQGGLVIAGSSSIRRWEGAFRLLSAYDPVQRGFGGAWMREIAWHADRLILRHAPDGVLVFAGTNDAAGGASVDEVVTAWRCLAARLHEAQPGAPLLWIGVTPTPSRWGGWGTASAINAEVEAWSAQHPSLVYVDVPAAFLETGAPPEGSLFVSDQLHLSRSGYALWESVVAPVVEAHVPEIEGPPPAGPPPGSYIRVDLGPSNAEDGDLAPEVDGFGNHWNAWHEVSGGAQILAGEALRGLRTTAGEVTQVDLVISGGFRCNGRRNGGLAAPDGALLGTMAVPEATVDYFYTGDADDPGGLSFTGLNPDARYTLRLFASRDSSERRVTRYVVDGAVHAERTLQTSGAGASADGGGGNNDSVVVLEGLAPDAWGRLHVDVQVEEGTYAYLALVELQAEL